MHFLVICLSSLENAYLYHVFPNSVGWCFTFPMVPFKILFKNVDEVKFVYFSLVAWTLGVIAEKTLPNPRFKIFISLLSSKSFTMLVLTFWSLPHFELFFYMVWDKGPHSFFSFFYSSYFINNLILSLSSVSDLTIMNLAHS